MSNEIISSLMTSVVNDYFSNNKKYKNGARGLVFVCSAYFIVTCGMLRDTGTICLQWVDDGDYLSGQGGTR